MYNQQPLQPQFTSYNVRLFHRPRVQRHLADISQPFQMMQMQQAEQQRQQEEYMRQQQMMQQQQQQQQQEEYMRQQYLQQQQQQQQALMAQPTGYRSNNPFAPSSSFLSPQNNPGSSNASGLFGSSPNQQTQSSFLPVPNVSLQSPPSQPTSPMEQPTSNGAESRPFGGNASPRPAKDDGQHAGLAGLLARGREDGLDTFGNMGNLRKCTWPLSESPHVCCTNACVGIPTGSAFHNSNRMAIQKTGQMGGNNPFGQMQNQGATGSQGGQQAQSGRSDQPFFSI